MYCCCFLLFFFVVFCVKRPPTCPTAPREGEERGLILSGGSPSRRPARGRPRGICCVPASFLFNACARVRVCLCVFCRRAYRQAGGQAGQVGR